MKYILLIIATCFLAMPALAQRFEPIFDYSVKDIRTFTVPYHETLTLEMAYADNVAIFHNPSPKRSDISRLQIRNERGRIIAYSPTRIQSIPFCFGRNTCWVFQWKTIYPLPAIFKFNMSKAVIFSQDPPMIYTRRGGGEGFDEKFNIFFGVFGVFLMFLENAPYFCAIIFLTILLCLQISKFRDLPKVQQEWINRILMWLVPGPLPIPVPPYTITAILIMLLAAYGMHGVNVPFVVTICFVFPTFFLCCMRLARLKLAKMKP